MCEMTRYVPRTTLWEDFTIAELFGKEPIRETFRGAFNAWRLNYIYLTELAMVLKWKIWFWYDINSPITQVYSELYERACQYAIENMNGEKLDYFRRMIE